MPPDSDLENQTCCTCGSSTLTEDNYQHGRYYMTSRLFTTDHKEQSQGAITSFCTLEMLWQRRANTCKETVAMSNADQRVSQDQDFAMRVWFMFHIHSM